MADLGHSSRHRGNSGGEHPQAALSWRLAIGAITQAWRPLVLYEALMSWLITAALGPLALAFSYRLIELSGETALGNADLARFLLSPLGIVALVLGAGLSIGLLLIEYSGLILLTDAAVHGNPLTLWQLISAIAVAAPRLLVLAVAQWGGALLAALPLAALAGATYWLLLSGTDINFYLTERPPRFWLALAVGGVLLAGLTVIVAWFFVGWAFAVPDCVLEGRGGLAALRSSWRLPRAAAWRLVLSIVAWHLLGMLVAYAVMRGFDRLNHALLAGSLARLSLLVWSTMLLVLLEAIALQVVGALVAIGTALLVVYFYRRVCPWDPSSVHRDNRLRAIQVAPPATWLARMTAVALLIAVPAASVLVALTWSHQFVEHRLANVTAHRAGSRAAPENSRAALRQAIAAGADYVEIDVQLTPDGHVVLLHDRDLRRVTGDARRLDQVNLAELQQLRLRSVGGYEDETIPTLAEFLDACDDRIRLNVELKAFGDGPRLALAVLDVLRERDFLPRAVVSCFEMPPLRALRSAEPDLPVGVILSAIQGDATRLPVDFLSVQQRLARGDLVRRAHRRGLQVHVWGVADRETTLRLLDLGCDNLITPDPALVRQVVDEYAELGDLERMLLRLRRWLRE